MEGLVKGLINVALDQIRGGTGDDRDERDDRSRSTWAEVVSASGEPDGPRSEREDTGHGRITEDHGRNNDGWERAGRKPQHKDDGRNSDGCETDGRRPLHKEDKRNNAGWETVDKKPHHKVSNHMWGHYKRPLAEQEYSDGVECGAETEPTQEELHDLGKAVNKLWELDINRLSPGKDYEIDCGGGKKVHQTEDMARGSLFSWVRDEVFTRPTYARFCSLLDNYNPHEGYKENVTDEERHEQAAFIEEISRTAPINYLHKYLLAKGMASENEREFKEMLRSLWFDLYARGGTSNSSSAFEHVFVGEIKQQEEQEVVGFHNWIQFYLEEAKGRVDYQGYIFPRRRGHSPDSETQLLTIQFEWNGILKSVSSTLIGVSPEFELAVYTLCFYLGGEDNYVELGPYPVNIKCYRFRNRIGSAFPVAES